jgi:hypothetical protein
MGLPQQLTISVVNSVQGDTNPALVSFVFVGEETSVNDFAGAALAYMDGALRTIGISGLKITGCTVAPIDGGKVGAGVAVPFPTAEYAAKYASVENATLHTQFPMSTGVGNGTWAPRGSSILMTEFTATGGRHNGRHYLPFACKECINGSTGLVYDTAQASLQNAWNAAFFDIAPQVVTKATGTAHTILAVKASSNVARLRSRMK